MTECPCVPRRLFTRVAAPLFNLGDFVDLVTLQEWAATDAENAERQNRTRTRVTRVCGLNCEIALWPAQTFCRLTGKCLSQEGWAYAAIHTPGYGANEPTKENPS